MASPNCIRITRSWHCARLDVCLLHKHTRWRIRRNRNGSVRITVKSCLLSRVERTLEFRIFSFSKLIFRKKITKTNKLLLSRKLPEIKSDSVDVEVKASNDNSNINKQPIETQKKSQKKGKKQMAEPTLVAVVPPVEEKKPAQPAPKNQKNNKKKNANKSNEVAEAVAPPVVAPAPVVVAAVVTPSQETNDATPTLSTKSKKQKSKKEKKIAAAAAAAKLQLQQQQQQQPATENDKNVANKSQPLQPATEKSAPNKKANNKTQDQRSAADSNKVAFDRIVFRNHTFPHTQTRSSFFDCTHYVVTHFLFIIFPVISSVRFVSVQ